MDSALDKIVSINLALCKKYPNGNGSFQIVARLLEEAGELAAEVNHFEQAGSKEKKHGAPRKDKLAKEAQDVIRCVMQLVTYYDASTEFYESVECDYRWATSFLATDGTESCQ